MKTEPTTGALRAAKKIVPVLKLTSQSANTAYESIFAEIIDKETGLPEILEALTKTNLFLVHVVSKLVERLPPESPVSSLLQGHIDLNNAAIAKTNQP